MADRLTPPVLLIGVGNDLRGDDAAGWRVAEAVAGWNRPGVTVVRTRQLVPELADAVAAATTVVLIDAVVGGFDTPVLTPVTAAPVPGPLAHTTSLPELLALSRGLAGRNPVGWVLGIPAESFDYGRAPSPRCGRAIEGAVGLLGELLPDG